MVSRSQFVHNDIISLKIVTVIATDSLHDKTISHPGPPLVPLVSDMPVSVRHRFQENITQCAGVKCTGVAVRFLNQLKKREKVQKKNQRTAATSYTVENVLNAPHTYSAYIYIYI